MHEIPLNLVKLSPNPVRKTWDETKMQELTQSIKEQGVIVPIKVRPSQGVEPCGYGRNVGHGFDAILGDPHLSNDNYEASELCHGCLMCIEELYEDKPEFIIEDGHEVDYSALDRLLDGDIPTDPPFEVVYGHRRVEAVKRAGLDEIPAIVEGVEDTDAIWQALIENLSNEDMSAYDKGEEIEKLKQAGFSVSEQSRRIGISDTLMYRWRDYYLERKSGLRIPSIDGSEMVQQVQEIGRAIKDDLPMKQAVVNKSVADNLNWQESRYVADAVVAAETPELKQAILDTSGKLGSAERITQVAEMKLAGRHVADGQEIRREKAFQDFDSAVKDYLDAIKMLDRLTAAAVKAAKYGKFSPEAKPFTIRKIDRLIDELETLKEALSND